jgi:transcriptional regulator with XRE-family HTH domain
MPYTQEGFLRDIEILREKRVLVKDKEISENTGFSTPVVSNYLSGRVSPSKNFLQKFYAFYRDSLKTNVFTVEEGTPIYELSATASKNEYSGQLPEVPAFRVSIPGYEDCNFGMHVYGHSMYPTIENGSLILCRKVSDKSVIMYGEIYLIRTKDYLMVKRLQKNSEKGHVLCTSDNFEQRNDKFKRFEPFELSIDKIIDLYLIKGIIKKTQS